MMMSIPSLLNNIEAVVGSNPFLLCVFATFFSLKAYLLITLIMRSINAKTANRPSFYLILVLFGTLFGDAVWILKLVRSLFIPNIDFRIYTFLLRTAWGFAIVQYQALALFIESLVEQKNRLKLHQKIFLFISTLFFFFFIGLAIENFNCFQTSEKPSIEFTMQLIETLYLLFPVILSSLFIIIRKLRSTQLPRILTKQIKLLVLAVIAPYWLLDFLQIYPFNFSPTWITNSYTFVSLSNILLTFAVYYCSRRIIGLRFLNFNDKVKSSIDINFMNNFKTVLEQFSHVTNMRELQHISQGFFKEAFNIPLNRTMLYIRKTQVQETDDPISDEFNQIPSLVETFLNTQKTGTAFIKQAKILLYDEIAFSHFYEQSEECKTILNFLEVINADIFLPIYEKDKLIAYIIVDRLARFDQFYSNVEHDEMLVFASYLGNIINLMQHKNLDALVQKEKELQEELYRKHQEINQYKESIRSFLRSSKQKAIGIIFYKNRRFTFGNQAAKELIPINLNVQEGHPLTKALKQIAQQVEAYKSAQTCFAKDADGTKLVLAGVPSLEHNNIIISVYYPEIADILKKQVDMLKDPSEWDYLLYLETTKPGKLINQLIPGSGEMLLNFKIELLKTALSKKAILLDMPDEDLEPTVELLHHISLRETLHIIELNNRSHTVDIAAKLFGVNPLFGVKTDEPPLLEKLDDVGTLFIKNIHFLDRESQEYLAEFIRYGFFRIFKSDQKIPSNVRIICSTNQNLQHLVQEGTFSKALFHELKHTALSMPSLVTLPEAELSTLAEGFSEQAIANQTFKNLLELTEKDKTKLAYARPASLQELKAKVQQLLIHKSQKNQIFHETQFDPAYQISDPELIEAARLGKHALKDHKILTMLWNKFEKNQNKIATFLGVNRSSVNRRCKKYNLQ